MSMFNHGKIKTILSKEMGLAIQAFEEALKLNPQAAQAYYFLGYSYYELKDLKKAREAFSQVYQLDAQYRPRRRTSGSEEDQ